MYSDRYFSMREPSLSILVVLFCFMAYACANSKIDEQCETQIQKTFPEAVCHANLDPISCAARCKKQAEIKCGRGNHEQIQKLQCRKRRHQTGLHSCCCRVQCKGNYFIYRKIKSFRTINISNII